MKGLIDTTLREGAQSVGVNFSRAEKIRIVHLLSEINIEEIELGLAADHAEMGDLLAACRTIKGKTRFGLWCRCRPDDVAAAALLQPDVLSLSIPASDLHLEKRLRRNRQWAMESLRNSIGQAVAAKLPYISVGLEDASRADYSFLEQLSRIAEEAGAARIRLADTVGAGSPEMTKEMVNRLRKATTLEIAIHAHNDFGMATANTIAALDAGADWGDVSVLGLGERAGLAKLEEVAGFLAIQRGQINYRTDLLKNLCYTVSQAANRAIAPHHPVIGEAIFTCETGLHLQGLMREPNTYEPFAPNIVGGKRKLLFGVKTGNRAIQELLANHQLTATLPVIEKLTETIRQLASLQQRPLTATEIIKGILNN